MKSPGGRPAASKVTAKKPAGAKGGKAPKAGAATGRVKAVRKRQPRRQYLVDRKTQIRFTVKLVLIVYIALVAQLVLTHVHLVNLQAQIQEIPITDGAKLQGFDRDLQTLHRRFHLAKAAYFLVGAGFLAVTGAVTSHRLAGPVVRLKRHLAGPLFGAAPTIAFRRSDHLEELTAGLRTAAQSLAARREELATTLDNLADRARQVGRESSPDVVFELVDEMEELARSLTAFMESSAEA